MCKRAWYTYKVVLLIKPFVSLTSSLPSCCWIFKSLMFPAKEEQVMPFDVGITWMPMLNGKANSCSQWFLSLCSIETSLEKPLFAGHRCNKHVQWTCERKAISAKTHLERLSAVSRPSVDPLLTDYQLLYRPTVDRLSTDYRPSIDRLSTECRPLYRLLYRPISRWTLPTVNKIHKITVTVCSGAS